MVLKSSLISYTDIRFTDFIWKDRTHRWYLISAVVLSIGVFLIFKQFYPNPNMVMDSYVYIRAMALHQSVNSYPIGYSRFLLLFSLLSRSTTVLVWFQYLFLESACGYFFFTLLFFLRPGKWTQRILFAFLFLNPLFLYLANFIMADTVFIALSLLWFTQQLHIIGRPKPYLFFVQAILLFLAFTIRYNALYYPVISMLAILLSRWNVRLKVAAIVWQFALIGCFVAYTQAQMKNRTGVRQFSPFGGWQLANNALYMYGEVWQERQDPPPPRFFQVDSIVRLYFAHTPVRDQVLSYVYWSTGSTYMGKPGTPLLRYMYWKEGPDTSFQDLKKWGSMGSYFGEYGSWLIHHYPLDYAHYFMFPNFCRYLVPPTEIFSAPSPYYLRDDELGQPAIQWFGLKSLAARPAYIEWRTELFSLAPVLMGLIQLGFLAGLIGFILFKGFRKVDRVNVFILVIITCCWICDLGFSVTASPIVLRYRTFLLILEFAGMMVTMDFIKNFSSAD